MVTLGISIGDASAWLLVLWACICFLVNQDFNMEMLMTVTYKTGMDILAVLWAATPSTRKLDLF